MSQNFQKIKSIFKFGSLAVMLGGLIIAANTFGFTTAIGNTLQNILEWIDSLGFWGTILFILIYILASILFISGAILTLGAGAIYGVVQGSILVSIASTLAGTIAFLIGRYVARGWVTKKISTQAKFQAIDEAVAKEGWKIVGLTRLSPLFPFVFLNYAFGLTKISLKNFILASWIGMLPGTIMYVYLGSLIGNIANLSTGTREKTLLEWSLYVIGLLSTIAVSLYVTKIAKKALNTQIVGSSPKQ